MKISEAIGKALLSTRTELGVSQRQLAARVALTTPMPRTYISKIENGGSVPGIENIHALSLALGITAHELVHIAEEMMEGRAHFPVKVQKPRTEIAKKFTRAPEVTSVQDPDAIARRRALAKKLGTLKDEVTQ